MNKVVCISPVRARRQGAGGQTPRDHPADKRTEQEYSAPGLGFSWSLPLRGVRADPDTSRAALRLCVHNIHPTCANGARCVSAAVVCKHKNQAPNFQLIATRHSAPGPQITNMERTSSVRRRTVARQHKGEVMIAGEQLR